jgi:hypothetical protein
MYIYPCMSCGLALRCLDSDDEADMLIGTRSEYWGKPYECIRCGSSRAPWLEHEAPPLLLKALQVRDLTAQELFAAIEGLGLPEEAECTAESVHDAVNSGVCSVDVYDVPNTGRSIINSITCLDGRTLFLGAAPGGAVVYRVKRASSYVNSALLERLKKENGYG